MAFDETLAGHRANGMLGTGALSKFLLVTLGSWGTCFRSSGSPRNGSVGWDSAADPVDAELKAFLDEDDEPILVTLGVSNTGALRGPLIRHQGGTSRFPMRIRDVAKGGFVVVVPDDQVETAAGVASDLIARRARDAEHGVGECSMALLRQGKHTRMAVGFAGVSDDARERLRAELDVEWLIFYREDFGDEHQRNAYDYFRIETPDGKFSKTRSGLVHHDNEAVPRRLVEVAARHGDGLELRLAPTRSPGEVLEDASYRPLEADELDDDHDLSEWMGTPDWPGKDEPAKPRKRCTRRK